MRVTDSSPLDYLGTAVLILDEAGQIVQVNVAAESLLGASAAMLVGQPVSNFLSDEQTERDLQALLGHALSGEISQRRMHLSWRVAGRGLVTLDSLVMALEEPGLLASIELREPDAFQRIDREERQAALLAANQSLLRNLGHEVKNPLGGIRGAAQLLDAELSPSLREYTQVIMKEADRLTALVDRMLAPAKRSGPMQLLNIHEVLERVRSLVLAEFPQRLSIRRDYDTSLPEIWGDLEQLIQLVLNIVRNAAQALSMQPLGANSAPTIWLRTRVARQVTLHRQRHRLALQLIIEDNGPGIPEAIREEIFYPLVSGRPDGHGLGLTIAQAIVNQHGGIVGCESSPSGSRFEILLPLEKEDAVR